MTRRGGTSNPEFTSAALTRSRLSFTAPAGRPTIVHPGRPSATSTSTVTSYASMPITAAERTLASTRNASHARPPPRHRWIAARCALTRVTGIGTTETVDGSIGVPPCLSNCELTASMRPQAPTSEVGNRIVTIAERAPWRLRQCRASRARPAPRNETLNFVGEPRSMKYVSQRCTRRPNDCPARRVACTQEPSGQLTRALDAPRVAFPASATSTPLVTSSPQRAPAPLSARAIAFPTTMPTRTQRASDRVGASPRERTRSRHRSRPMRQLS